MFSTCLYYLYNFVRNGTPYYVGQYLVDSRPICWWHSVAIYSLSIDSWPILCWPIVDISLTFGWRNGRGSPPIPHRYSINDSPIRCRHTTDAISTNCWLICRLIRRLTGKHQLTEISVNTWPILDWLSSANMSINTRSPKRYMIRKIFVSRCYAALCAMRHNVKIIEHPVGLSFFNFFWLADTTKRYYTLRVWFLWFVGSKSFWSWVGMNIDLDLNEVSVAFCAGCSFFPTFSFTFWKSCSLSFLFLLFFAMSENRALSTDEDKFYQT